MRFDQLQLGDYFIWAFDEIGAPVWWTDGLGSATELFCADNRPMLPAGLIRPDAQVHLVDVCEICETVSVENAGDICAICWANRPNKLRQFRTPEEMVRIVSTVLERERILADILL